MFKSLGCLFGKHSRDRHRVWNDGISFRATCMGCSAPLIRDGRGWRRFELERDGHTAREPHPRATTD